jgi:hypothetical protein
MFSRRICGMQNAWAHCLELSSSWVAFLKLIIRCCTSCCRDQDLSHCRSCCCIVTSFKLVSPVAVFVAFIGTWKCEKLEVGTTVNWDRKLLIVEAGPSFEIGTENRSKSDLLFVSDFWGFVEKFTWARDVWLLLARHSALRMQRRGHRWVDNQVFRWLGSIKWIKWIKRIKWALCPRELRKPLGEFKKQKFLLAD